MPVQVPTQRDEVSIRRPIYTDVEELITTGFLAQTVEVAGITMAMRTFCPSDGILLRHRVGLNVTERTWREWIVSTSVWMIDGQVLLGDPNAASVVRQHLRSLSKGTIGTLFSIYTSLHNRLTTALARTEAFCYEEISRATWRMVGRRLMSGHAPDGLSHSLGMNHVQRMWAAYNEAEDVRIQWAQEWAAAKLVASAQSPKGVRRLNQREESDRKLEDERRHRIIAMTYHKATGKHVEDQSGYVVFRSVTSEELVEEMNRTLRGEKDFHDQVIDAYKSAIRERQEKARSDHDARMNALSDAEEVGVSGAAPLVGYTIEQIRALHGNEPRRGTTRVVDSAEPTRVYSKIVENEVPVGAMGDGGKGFAMPKPTMSLAEAVASRRPLLSDDGEV